MRDERGCMISRQRERGSAYAYPWHRDVGFRKAICASWIGWLQFDYMYAAPSESMSAMWDVGLCGQIRSTSLRRSSTSASRPVLCASHDVDLAPREAGEAKSKR